MLAFSPGAIMALPMVAIADQNAIDAATFFPDRPPLALSFASHSEPPAPPAGDGASGGGSERTTDEPFGLAGQQWWSISSGIGLSNETDIVGQFGYHRFLADDFELGVFLGGWYHDQSENDAASLSLSVQFRYHFINEDRWSVYGMAGAGVMGSSDNVPDGGTGFNFLPTLGVGGTLQLGDSRARLDGGVRWHHISNANINSSGRNPDRDAPMIYLGIMLPF